MTIKAGVQIFSSSPADDASVALAKGYIKLHELTQDNVRLLRGTNTVTVEAKKDLELSNKVFDINGQDQ